ncbi:MAG: HEAT repeat domain-containing protein [Acidimicrobiales bacterium]
MQPATEPDPGRVTDRRRDVAEAGHLGDVTRVREGLTDDSPAVRATALGAMDRLGALTADLLVSGLADADPGVRRRAVELAASHPDVGVSALLDDPDPSVVEMTAWTLGEREEVGAVAALSGLSATRGGHDDPLCREAAVAALGAIGDPTGLPAVLAALDDKPAVRRRAAVALAAFDGPEVEAALRRCLADRDWQVRQVAEDLLDIVERPEGPTGAADRP